MPSGDWVHLGVHIGWRFPEKVRSWPDSCYVDLVTYNDTQERWMKVPDLFVERFVEEFKDQIEWIENNLKDYQLKLFESNRYTGLGHTTRSYGVYRIVLYVKTPSDLILHKLRWK